MEKLYDNSQKITLQAIIPYILPDKELRFLWNCEELGVGLFLSRNIGLFQYFEYICPFKSI